MVEIVLVAHGEHFASLFTLKICWKILLGMMFWVIRRGRI